MLFQRGVTRLELAIVASLAAILFGTFLHAVRRQQEEAEKLLVELTIMSARTGLLSEVAGRVLAGRGRDVADLIGANPLRWLREPPPGYLGEFASADAGRLAPGSWYFDRAAGELVYRLNLASRFRRLDGSARPEIRWRLQLRQGSGIGETTAGDVALVPAVSYEWL